MDLEGRLVVIAGAMRAGTTSLHRWLGAHPMVTASRLKEPHHFGLGGPPSWTGPGDQVFAAEMGATLQEYRDLFRGAGPADILVDGSAMTMHIVGAARSLAGQVTGARAIVLLRDPVQRARSAHAYQRARGFEPLPDLADGLSAEDERRTAGWAPLWWYGKASSYADEVSELQQALGPSQVHVILSEQLWAEPDHELDRLCGWLGLSACGPPLASVNRGGEPRVKWLVSAAYRLPPSVRTRIGHRPRRVARRVLDGLTATRRGVPDGLEQRLGAAFSDDVAKLGELLGRDDLARWWPSVPSG